MGSSTTELILDLLLGLDEHDFLRVRYRPAIAQRQRNHRSRKVCVRQVLADGNDRIRKGSA